jgi:hypothetical protein
VPWRGGLLNLLMEAIEDTDAVTAAIVSVASLITMSLLKI